MKYIAILALLVSSSTVFAKKLQMNHGVDFREKVVCTSNARGGTLILNTMTLKGDIVDSYNKKLIECEKKKKSFTCELPNGLIVTLNNTGKSFTGERILDFDIGYRYVFEDVGDLFDRWECKNFD